MEDLSFECWKPLYDLLQISWQLVNDCIVIDGVGLLLNLIFISFCEASHAFLQGHFLGFALNLHEKFWLLECFATNQDLDVLLLFENRLYWQDRFSIMKREQSQDKDFVELISNFVKLYF